MRTQPKTIVVAGESVLPHPTRAIKKPKSQFTPPKRSPLKSSPLRNLKPSPIKTTSPIKAPSLLKRLQNLADNVKTPTHSSSLQKSIERNEVRSLDKTIETEKSKPLERAGNEKTAKPNKIVPSSSKGTRLSDLQVSPITKKATPIKSLRRRVRKNMPYTPPSSPETLVVPPHISLPVPYNPSPSISARSEDSFDEKEEGTPILRSSKESQNKKIGEKNEMKRREDNFLDNANFDRKESLTKNASLLQDEERKKLVRNGSLERNESPARKKASPQKNRVATKNNRTRKTINDRRQEEEDEDYKEEEEEEEEEEKEERKEEQSFFRSPSESPFPSPRRRGGVQSKSKAIKKGGGGGGGVGGGASHGKIGTSNNARSNGGRRSNFAAMVLPTPPPPANNRRRNAAKGGGGKKRGKAEDSTSLNSEERNFREGTKRKGENFYMNVETELNQLFEESEDRERQESSERNVRDLQKYTSANMISSGLISERKNTENLENPEFSNGPEKKKYHSKWSKRLDWKLDRKLFNNMTDTELCLFFNNATWFTWNIETEEIEEEDEDGKKKRNLRRRQNAQKSKDKKGEGQNSSPGQKGKKAVGDGKGTITRYVASGYLNFDGEEINIDPVSCFDSQLKANGMCFKKMMKEVLDRVEEKEFFVRFEVMDRDSYYDGMNLV